MKLKHDPFPLIFAQGDDVTRLVCLEFFGLGNSPHARGCLLSLLKQQCVDGAFPSGLAPEHWGIQETIRHTLLLLKAEMPPTGVNVQAAVRFVLVQQRPDGGWRPFFAGDSSPTYTVLAVKALVLSGMVTREELEAGVKAYTI